MKEDASISKTPGQWVLPYVQALSAYTPGKQPQEGGWIKLNTNENPFPPSPRVEAAVQAEIEGLTLYPSPNSQALREALAGHYRLSVEQVLAGNGSDDVLNLIFRAFCPPCHGAALMLEPSYSLYPVLAAVQNTGIKKLPLSFDGSLDVEAIAGSGARVFFLTSPNAPTGIAFSPAQIAKAAEAFEGLVVVDEAYGEFAEENALGLLETHPNVLVTRSFSKSYGLAGLRVGYALGHPEAIAALDKVRDSYNLDRLAQAGAVAALEDTGYFQALVGKVCRIRDEYTAELRQRGWDTLPSQANFLFTEPKTPQSQVGEAVAADLFEHLYQSKILVRRFPGHALTCSRLRISIGTEDDMLALSEAIDTWSPKSA